MFRQAPIKLLYGDINHTAVFEAGGGKKKCGSLTGLKQLETPDPKRRRTEKSADGIWNACYKAPMTTYT